ncbi:hypothetical protein PFISCL1PPCAC_12984, partial [Pristionchus fissidentatus]
YIHYSRYAAFRFSYDYETNQRRWISSLIIASNTTFSATIALVLVLNLMDGTIYMFSNFCLSNLSCLIFYRIVTQNKRQEHRLTSFRDRLGYSVSRRWQVNDNIRLAKDIRIIIYGCSAQISFYLPIFFLPPLLLGQNPQWRSALELSKAVFQLL